MAKVFLELKTPLIVGAKRIKDNFITSVNYIPGNVLRAAFARKLLLECPVYDSNVTDSNDKYNMVFIRNKGECDKCERKEICENFSNIKFSFFYPENADVIPFTAEKCKYHNEHGFLDGMFKHKNGICEKCKHNKEEGRMESVNGLRLGNKVLKLDTVQFTKTAIDKYTKTAKDGSLFTIEAIKEKDENKNYIKFTGTIDGYLGEFLKKGDIIRVGKKIASGYGKFEIVDINDNDKFESLVKRIDKFNNRIRSFSNEDKIKKIKNYDEKKTYIPILFKSNARLGIENENLDKVKTNEDFKVKWKELILKGEFGGNFEIEKVWSENDIYKGYDTSMPWGKWERKPIIQTLFGTTILVSTKILSDKCIEYLEKLESDGIGKDTKDGYGQVEICNELHMEGEIYNGKK